MLNRDLCDPRASCWLCPSTSFLLRQIPSSCCDCDSIGPCSKGKTQSSTSDYKQHKCPKGCHYHHEKDNNHKYSRPKVIAAFASFGSSIQHCLNLLLVHQSSCNSKLSSFMRSFCCSCCLFPSLVRHILIILADVFVLGDCAAIDHHHYSSNNDASGITMHCIDGHSTTV